MVDTQKNGNVSNADQRACGAPLAILEWQPEPPGIGLTVNVESLSRQTARVTLTGELDYHTAQLMRDALLSRMTWAMNWIEVDAAGLGFCDATGLALFVEFDRQCVQQGGGLRIINSPRQLTRMLVLTGVSNLLTRRSEDSLDDSEFPDMPVHRSDS